MTDRMFARVLDPAWLPARGKYVADLTEAQEQACDLLSATVPSAGELARCAAMVEQSLTVPDCWHPLDVVGVRPGRYSETDFEVDLGYVYPPNWGGYDGAVCDAMEAAGGACVVLGTVVVCYGGPGPHVSSVSCPRLSSAVRRYLTAVEEADGSAA